MPLTRKKRKNKILKFDGEEPAMQIAGFSFFTIQQQLVSILRLYCKMISNEKYISILLLSFIASMLAFVVFANYMYKDYQSRQAKLEQATEYNLD